MYAVEVYATVRQLVFVEGKSRREVARLLGLSRDTVGKMCRYSAPPGYVRTKESVRVAPGNGPPFPGAGPLLVMTGRCLARGIAVLRDHDELIVGRILI